MKRLLLIIAGIAVSFGSLAWAMKDTDLQALSDSLREINYLYTFPMFLLLFLFYWLKAVRWSWLLQPAKELTPNQLFRPLVIGFAANNILPAHLGEFVRVFVVNRQFQIPASTVLSTVVLERILDIVAILTLFASGIWYANEMPPEYQNVAVTVAVVCGGMVAAVVIYLFRTQFFISLTREILRFIPFVPTALSSKVLKMLEQGAVGLQALKSPLMILKLQINSLAQWLLNGLSACIALWALEIDVDFSTGLILTGITAFGVMIPAAPGYFGVIQVCFIVAMKAQSLQPDDADVLAASFFLQVPAYIVVTAAGVFFMQQLGLNLKQMTKSPAAEQDSVAAQGDELSNPGSPPTDNTQANS